MKIVLCTSCLLLLSGVPLPAQQVSPPPATASTNGGAAGEEPVQLRTKLYSFRFE